MPEALAIEGATRPWTLAALADEEEFDLYVEAAAVAIADRFTFQVHINTTGRAAAFADWITSVRSVGKQPPDHRAFISVCAGLIAALATHRVVSYSAMIGARNDRLAGVVLKYGNEATALAVGSGLYALAVEDLTGASPSEQLDGLVVENAADNLRRHPEAATRFRELMRLSNPWE